MSAARFLASAHAHAERIAVVGDGPYTYAELEQRALSVAAGLRAHGDLTGERIAYLVPPGIDHVAVQWGIWLAGGVAVPLALSHPPAEIGYVLEDSEAAVVVADPTLADRIPATASADVIITTDLNTPGTVADALSCPDALMIYTSGTTGRPKGVVTTHDGLNAQVASLHEAWEWSNEDRALLVLPLHHVHGVVNVMCCALWAGATCEMPSRFDSTETWERLASGEVTVFMAVPTIYRKLIGAWEAADTTTRARWKEGAATMRLMVSGSAALPVTTWQTWREITGQALLERYGMTEIGMALSNPLHGERRPGTVGQPLPTVDVKLRNPDAPSEILVRGPTVFDRYWNRPEETAEAFEDGWFRTGDTAIVEDGYYRILGRTSVDIIKSGGYKLSALEIEEACRSLDAVEECAVVGVPDEEWGEKVCIAVECPPGMSIDLQTLQDRLRDRMAPYKLPRALQVLPALPRNAMGKVTKHNIRELFERGTTT